MHNIKIMLAAVLGGLLVLFAIQNTAEVELTFFAWTFQSRRFVVIGISVTVGLVIGWVIAMMRGRHV